MFTAKFFVDGSRNNDLRLRITNNRKNTLFLTYQGITLPLTVWSDRLGINRHTLRDRVTRRGWSVEDAFTKPIQRHKKMNGERRGNTEKRF